MFVIVVGCMLKVDPTDRPNISDVIARLQEIAAARNVSLKSPINITDSPAPAPPTHPSAPAPQQRQPPPPPNMAHNHCKAFVLLHVSTQHLGH